MRTRSLIKLSLPALLLAGATGAVASARDAGADAKAAAQVAAKATRALARRDAAGAVALAERAVALSPQDAGHRALLGQAYLRAGRFASARDTLEEALALDGRDGRSALSLVLAQIACGDRAEARETLDRHAEGISGSDYGLAVALAGDPASAVGLLNQAARSPGAGPRTRQNLALALALAGRWRAASVVAAADMSPGDVDRRMVEWAAFAQPRAASDQVAQLLGVEAAADAGRPAALALNRPAAPAAVAEAAPVPAAAPARAKVSFAPAREVVQALPAATTRRGSQTALIASTRGPGVAVGAPIRRGKWYIQLGAYDSSAVAHDAWNRAIRRFGAFRGRTPTGMSYSTAKGGFYRLSVGGFARADAVSLCERYRARGGECFVRGAAGDQIAQWLRKPGAALAMR